MTAVTTIQRRASARWPRSTALTASCMLPLDANQHQREQRPAGHVQLHAVGAATPWRWPGG